MLVMLGLFAVFAALIGGVAVERSEPANATAQTVVLAGQFTFDTDGNTVPSPWVDGDTTGNDAAVVGQLVQLRSGSTSLFRSTPPAIRTFEWSTTGDTSFILEKKTDRTTVTWSWNGESGIRVPSPPWRPTISRPPGQRLHRPPPMLICRAPRTTFLKSKSDSAATRRKTLTWLG